MDITPERTEDPAEELDAVIIGAGISGVAMARQLGRDHPDLSVAVLEGRGRIGGTWDLFRYPGLRSDSGMDTFAYSFRPWPGTRHFGGGRAIREYVEETAAEAGVTRLIRFGHRVTATDWDSSACRWTVRGTGPDGEFRLRCRFLFGCTGYFRYDRGHSPALPGEENFGGELFHAQDWPEGFDPEGRWMIVVGSGATAITMVPALADAGAHVTMLQRSPSYVVAVPDESRLVQMLKRRLPRRWWSFLLRWAGVVIEIAQFRFARRFPNLARRLVVDLARRRLPEGFDTRHLTPRYNPWTQRVCFSPDGDLFAALSSGRARVETGEIERIEPDRITLRDGSSIDADVIVKATGLDLLLFGGVTVSVDGETVDPADRLVYRGSMLAGVPNFAFTIGYTNASWTLKAELVARFASRLVEEADRRGVRSVMPVAPDSPMQTSPLLNLDSGYIRRAESRLPKAGDRRPWLLHMNYFADRRELLRGSLDDGTLRFD